jgi:hypothetical protein
MRWSPLAPFQVRFRSGEVVLAGQGAGVVFAENAAPDRKGGPVQISSFSTLPETLQCEAEVGLAGQGVKVVFAENAAAGSQGGPEQISSFSILPEILHCEAEVGLTKRPRRLVDPE